MLVLVLPFFPGASEGSNAAVVVPPLVFPSEYAHGVLHPVYSDPYSGTPPVWYGGGFRASLPVTNVGTDALEEFARTTNLSLTNTQARCNLQQIRTVRAVGVPKGNYGPDALYRVTLAYSDGDLTAGPEYQSTWLNVWPTGVTQEQALGLNVGFVHHCVDGSGNPIGVDCQYAMIEFSDTTNPAGYLDIARVMVGGFYNFPSAASVGASMGFEDDTEETLSEGGSAHYTVRRIRRRYDLEFGRISEVDAFTDMWDMLRRLGRAGTLMFAFDRNDPLAWKRTFYGSFRELGAAEWAWSSELRRKFVIVERL